jgi:hypothetical protein
MEANVEEAKGMILSKQPFSILIFVDQKQLEMWNITTILVA